MNVRHTFACAIAVAAVFATSGIGRFGGGGFSRPAGGFDFHNDAPSSLRAPQGGTHSSTGPYGTNRTTTVSNNGSGYNRTTSAQNGGYSRTSSGSLQNGNYSHSTNGSSPYGSRSGSTSGNVNSGNFSHSASGSNVNGSYSNSGSGNAYDRTYSGSGTATNAWGQTYHTGTYVNNGTVYHGTYVTNPVYGAYPAWGWNAGVVWWPAPYYWGGGFWGPFAIGAATAAIYGSFVANNVTYTSYEVQPSSPGAKLLASYSLTQTQCGPPNLVVIYGPNNSVICAFPNNLVAAGTYGVNEQTLTIVSQKPSS